MSECVSEVSSLPNENELATARQTIMQDKKRKQPLRKESEEAPASPRRSQRTSNYGTGQVSGKNPNGVSGTHDSGSNPNGEEDGGSRMEKRRKHRHEQTQQVSQNVEVDAGDTIDAEDSTFEAEEENGYANIDNGSTKAAEDHEGDHRHGDRDTGRRKIEEGLKYSENKELDQKQKGQTERHDCQYATHAIEDTAAATDADTARREISSSSAVEQSLVPRYVPRPQSLPCLRVRLVKVGTDKLTCTEVVEPYIDSAPPPSSTTSTIPSSLPMSTSSMSLGSTSTSSMTTSSTPPPLPLPSSSLSSSSSSSSSLSTYISASSSLELPSPPSLSLTSSLPSANALGGTVGITPRSRVRNPEPHEIKALQMQHEQLFTNRPTAMSNTGGNFSGTAAGSFQQPLLMTHATKPYQSPTLRCCPVCSTSNNIRQTKCVKCNFFLPPHRAMVSCEYCHQTMSICMPVCPHCSGLQTATRWNRMDDSDAAGAAKDEQSTTASFPSAYSGRSVENLEQRALYLAYLGPAYLSDNSLEEDSWMFGGATLVLPPPASHQPSSSLSSGGAREQTQQSQDQISVTTGRQKLWTVEEDTMLRSAVSVYGPQNWAAIATYIPGRSHTSCQSRWNKYLRPDATRTNPTPRAASSMCEEPHKWTTMESAEIVPQNVIPNQNLTNAEPAAMKTVTHGDSSSTALEVPALPSELGKASESADVPGAIKYRGAWNESEERTLLQLVQTYGTARSWDYISSCFPWRTRSAVKTHWNINLHPRMKKMYPGYSLASFEPFKEIPQQQQQQHGQENNPSVWSENGVSSEAASDGTTSASSASQQLEGTKKRGYQLWSRDDNIRLRELVAEMQQSGRINWADIASQFRGRTSCTTRRHWRHMQEPKARRGRPPTVSETGMPEDVEGSLNALDSGPEAIREEMSAQSSPLLSLQPLSVPTLTTKTAAATGNGLGTADGDYASALHPSWSDGHGAGLSSATSPTVKHTWGASKFIGVSRMHNSKKWRCSFKQRYLGSFWDEAEAARRYDAEAVNHGLPTNFPVKQDTSTPSKDRVPSSVDGDPASIVAGEFDAGVTVAKKQLMTTPLESKSPNSSAMVVKNDGDGDGGGGGAAAAADDDTATEDEMEIVTNVEIQTTAGSSEVIQDQEEKEDAPWRTDGRRRDDDTEPMGPERLVGWDAYFSVEAEDRSEAFLVGMVMGWVSAEENDGEPAYQIIDHDGDEHVFMYDEAMQIIGQAIERRRQLHGEYSSIESSATLINNAILRRKQEPF